MTNQCDNGGENLVPIKYLHRRDDGKSSNYYVRLVAPTDIQALLPKKDRVYRQSTGTADIRIANVRGAEMVARKLKEWQAVRVLTSSEHDAVRASLTPTLIEQISGARLQSWLFTDDDDRLGESGLSEADLRLMNDFCEFSDAQMRSVLIQGKGSKEWQSVVDEVLEWCSTLGYEVEPSDPEFPKLVRAFANAERNAQEIISARNRGEVPSLDNLPIKTGTVLSAMVDEYVKYKTPIVQGPKPVSMAVSIWNKFIEFRGDVFLDEVTSKDIYDFFFAQLYTVEKKWSQGYVDGHATRTLKEVFSLAIARSFMRAENPFSKLGMTPKLSLKDKLARQKPRFAFSSEQLNLLFSSGWYIPETTVVRGKIQQDKAARYFCPLIGLFHGSRVREYLQLMTSDIVEKDGVLCFKFQIDIDAEREREDDSELNVAKVSPSKKAKSVAAESLGLPNRTLKNMSVTRIIPIHPKLIELGFARYVDERREQLGALGPLFESSPPTAGGKAPMWGRAFEQSFLRYVRDKLRFGNGFGSHSFRHLFEDRLKSAQAIRKTWPAGLANFLSGRKLPRDVDRDFFRESGSEESYGNGYGPVDVLPYLESVNFPDVNLPKNFYDWIKD